LGLKAGTVSVEQQKSIRGEEETNMDQQDKLRAKLVEYGQNVHAMEQ
jgi:hypothetical protein